MAGRPKRMARRLEQIHLYPWDLVERLDELIPKQYRRGRPGEKYEELWPSWFPQTDSNPSEQIGMLWRLCSDSALLLAIRMEYLLVLLKEKAGIPDPESEEELSSGDTEEQAADEPEPRPS